MCKQFMIKTACYDYSGKHAEYLFFDTRHEAETMYNKILLQFRMGMRSDEPGFYRAISKDGLYMKER